MLKIQARDFSAYLEDIQIQLVRTYKGEIARTLSGVVAAFPASFITTGFSIQLLGPRAQITQAQQLLLSSNTVLVVLKYNNTEIQGNFSCTNVESAEVRDKSDRSVRLTASLVSDGSQITKPGGALFTVKYGTTTLKTTSFAKVVNLGSTPQYKVSGALLPGNNLLVLGDTVVEV